MNEVDNIEMFQECYAAVFLISLENIFEVYVGVWFNFIKKDTLAQAFSCKFCKIFKNIFFSTTLPVAASAQLCQIWITSKAFLIGFYY